MIDAFHRSNHSIFWHLPSLFPDNLDVNHFLSKLLKTYDVLQCGIDLLLCRDTLQHLSLASCYSLLRNLSNANSKYYLIGSYVTGQNVAIREGEYFSAIQHATLQDFLRESPRYGSAEAPVFVPARPVCQTRQSTWYNRPGTGCSGGFSWLTITSTQ